MIVTVTMNPAIDKTIEVENLEIGNLNRIKSSVFDVGGKGINVSKTINAIGGQSIATGFIGGSTGNLIQTTLEKLGISTDFVQVNGETRTNTKVFTNNYPVTELNEIGEEITKEQLDTLIEKIVSYAKPDTLFVLAGSIPAGVPNDVYKTITEKVHEKGSKVILDADGELFKVSILAKPDVIKPNRDELARYASIEGKITQRQLVDITSEFFDAGISTVVVSMGKEGASFFDRAHSLKCDPMDVPVLSTVGAGDAMVAGLAYSIDKNLEFEEMIKLSMATSNGAVTTHGTKPPSKELVEQLKPLARISLINK